MAQVVNGRELPPPPASPVGTLIVIVLLLMAGGVAVKEFLLAPPGPVAAAAGETEARPTLMLFTADWCPACRVLDSQTLSKPDVKRAINARGVRFVVVDLTETGGANEQLANQYKVRSIPTMVLLDERGITKDRVSGAMPPEHFVRWLDKHTKK